MWCQTEAACAAIAAGKEHEDQQGGQADHRDAAR